MIWQWLISVVALMTAPLRSVLPTITLPFNPTEPTLIAQSIGNKLALANWIIPLYETLDLLTTLITFVLPAVIIYTIANWIWRHIPELWGFGPGAG